MEVKVVTLNLTLLFGFDRAQVTPFHYDELKKAVEFIDKYPMFPVVTKGHTDAQGSAEYNQDLSQWRANNVRKALLDKYVEAADCITAIGFGETPPIADNVIADGRRQNRRVEINMQP